MSVEIKRQLDQWAETYVTQECENKFKSILMESQYKMPKAKMDLRDKNQHDCLKSRPVVMSMVPLVSDKEWTPIMYCAIVDPEGHKNFLCIFKWLGAVGGIRNNETVSKFHNEEKDRLKNLLVEYKVDLIVIGTQNVMVKRIQETIKSLFEANNEDPNSTEPWITWGKLTIPRI